MPCMMNGKPVPGAFGSCPTGSKWQDNNAEMGQQSTPSLSMSEQDYKNMDEWEQGGAQNMGDYLTPGGVFKAGAGLALSAPFIRGGVNTLKKNKSAIFKKMQSLKEKLFMRKNTPVRPKFPIMNRAQEAAWRARNPSTMKYDPLKIAALASAAGLSIDAYIQSTGSEPEKSKSTKPAGPYAMTDAQRMQQLDSSVPEQTAMQKLGANMKDPKWWTESISGLPSDTRLMRMGQLMDYYGRGPKGRAAVDMPSKVWAANEAASQAAKAKVLASKGTTPDAYKWSFGDTNKALDSWYDDKFGTDYPFGKDGAALKSKFMNDVTDEKRRYPSKNLEEIAEALLLNYPNKYI